MSREATFALTLRTPRSGEKEEKMEALTSWHRSDKGSFLFVHGERKEREREMVAYFGDSKDRNFHGTIFYGERWKRKRQKNSEREIGNERF